MAKDSGHSDSFEEEPETELAQPTAESELNAPEADVAPTPPEEQQPEPAPTDYGRNAWLLIIILGVVVIAWVVSLLARPADGTEPPPTPPAEPGRQPEGTAPPPRRPSQQNTQPDRDSGPEPPSYQQVEIKATDARSYVNATPPLRLRTGQPYRRARLFDVTETADSFVPAALWRQGTLQERHAGQVAVRDVAAVEPDRRPEVLRPVSDVPGELMDPHEELVVVTVDDATSAYPVRLMRLRDPLIADVISGRDVLVVWHFAMQTASALEMDRGQGAVPYGDAGLLYRGAHVLYDRATRSLWDAYSGTAITGPRSGTQLSRLDAGLQTWQPFRQAHPDAHVYLPPGSEGAFRQEVQTAPLLARREVPFSLVNYHPWDPAAHALPAMEHVLGARVGDAARAYPIGRLYAGGIRSFSDTLGGQVVDIQLTSPKTGFAEGEGLQQAVMLWYAWKDRNPETTVYTPEATGERGNDE
jgi:hypothetical protein